MRKCISLNQLPQILRKRKRKINLIDKISISIIILKKGNYKQTINRLITELNEIINDLHIIKLITILSNKKILNSLTGITKEFIGKLND